MSNRYARPLKVSNVLGERVIANVYPQKYKVRIKIKYYEVIKKDNPPFAKDGVISLTCLKSEYRKTINLLTRYFENLFLKGMADEDIYSSLGIKSKSRGNKKVNKPKEIEGAGGKGNTSGIHSGTRREQSTKGSGRGKSSPEMDKSGDTSPIGKD